MGFHKKTIRDIEIGGETVLVRADYNVPQRKDGSISDDLRIRASLPTLQYLLKKKCRIVIMSHLGRPNGAEKKYSLEPVAHRLSELLGKNVLFVDRVYGDRVEQVVKKYRHADIILLENLRFHKEEEANDETFAKEIAKSSGAKYFVQDGFGVVHRAHASTSAITLCLPSVAGLLLEKEYTTITNALESPGRPLVTIMGGAKVSDKIKVIEKFIDVSDQILIGGAMANTFLAYKGIHVGKSIFESGQKQVLNSLYAKAAKKVGWEKVDDFIILPTDVAVGKSTNGRSIRRNVSVREIGGPYMALDIGDQSINTYASIVSKAKTVIWNGPVGYAELEEFAHGSARIALALAASDDVVSIVGGGDTADFVLKWGKGDGSEFTHVSTGGGAGLELMAGDKLPGIESLLDARQ